MLSRAVEEECWNVVMVWFNLLNPSAGVRVLISTQANNPGVEMMR